jgi:FkbM family methyltransferase
MFILLDKLHLLKYFSFYPTKKIGNHNFHIPVINGIGYGHLFSPQEEWMHTIIQKLYRQRSGCIVDVGVNIGQTLLKIASLDKNINYYGFEPNPACYFYCKSLLNSNQINTFKIFPVGLFNKSEIVKLFGSNDIASGASVENVIGRKNFKEIHLVPVMRGDPIFSNEKIEEINFIKVDVEGAELEVMQGCKLTVERFQPIIIMEILPVYSLEKAQGKTRKERQDNLLQLMRELNYKMFLIHEKTVQLEMIDDIPVHGDMSRTNYMFIPSDQTKGFNDLLISRP